MKKRTRVREKSAAAVILIGAPVQAVFLALISLILAFVSTLTENPTALVGIFSIAAVLLSGLISGGAISKYKGEGGILTAILSSLLFVLLLLLAALIISRGELGGAALLNAVIYLVSAALGAAAGNRIGKGRKKRRK